MLLLRMLLPCQWWAGYRDEADPGDCAQTGLGIRLPYGRLEGPECMRTRPKMAD